LGTKAKNADPEGDASRDEALGGYRPEGKGGELA
jgi:hypothetical protein